jgi:hypothetical protein
MMDYKNEPDILSEVDACKAELLEYYTDHYAGRATFSQAKDLSSLSGLGPSSSPKEIDFISRYEEPDDESRNELEEYFRLPAEHFRTCDPITWWSTRSTQYPNLCRLARDILSIPGRCHLMLEIY